MNKVKMAYNTASGESHTVSSQRYNVLAGLWIINEMMTIIIIIMKCVHHWTMSSSGSFALYFLLSPSLITVSGLHLVKVCFFFPINFTSSSAEE